MLGNINFSNPFFWEAKKYTKCLLLIQGHTVVKQVPKFFT